MSKPGTPVRSVTKGRIVLVEKYSDDTQVEDEWPSMANVWIYDDDTNILYSYQHLDRDSLPDKIRNGVGFNPKSQMTLEAGEYLGQVGNWYFEGPETFIKNLPPWVQNFYDNKGHHLHFGAVYAPRFEEMWSLYQLAEDEYTTWLNPLHLIIKVDDLVDEESPDNAMVSEKRQDASAKMKPGGIDLNPQFLDLQIKRDPNGVPLPIEMQPIQDMKIDGFYPVIINITPIPNLPLMLGFDFGHESDTEYGHNYEYLATEPEKISLLQ